MSREKPIVSMNRNALRQLAFLLLFVPVLAFGEQSTTLHKLLFHSGRVVVGEIVLRNDEVVIVKDSYGSRFQFPMSDVVEITEVIDKDASEKHEEDVASRTITNAKRTSLGIHVAGGLVNLDGSTGGSIAADVRLGANNLGGRRIFLGGQVGYRALLVEKKTLSIIPIDVVTEIPLMQGNHVPMIGANIGYGIGINNIRGGVNAGLTFGYRYHFSRTGAFHIGLVAEVQQIASMTHVIEVEAGQEFVSVYGRTAVMGMITLGVLF